MGSSDTIKPFDHAANIRISNTNIPANDRNNNNSNNNSNDKPIHFSVRLILQPIGDRYDTHIPRLPLTES